MFASDRILGECCLWGEFIERPREVEFTDFDRDLGNC